MIVAVAALPGCRANRSTPVPTARGASPTEASRGGGPPASVPPTGSSRLYAHCRPGDLAEPHGHWVSPATGENAFTVALTLVADGPCSIHGYPRVRLLDQAGRVLPFGFRRGKGQYVSNRHPRWVNLRPGQRVYAEVAKYRCDTNSYRRARTARIVVAGSRTTLPIPANVNMTYCGSSDPGSQLQLAPLAQRKAAVFPG